MEARLRHPLIVYPIRIESEACSDPLPSGRPDRRIFVVQLLDHGVLTGTWQPESAELEHFGVGLDLLVYMIEEPFRRPEGARDPSQLTR